MEGNGGRNGTALLRKEKEANKLVELADAPGGGEEGTVGEGGNGCR